MYFGSKYVYDNAAETEYDEVSEDMYEAGLQISDESDEDELESAAVDLAPAARPLSTSIRRSSMKKGKAGPELSTEAQGHGSGRKLKVQKADTNVVSITLNTLTKPSDMHAGDVVRCGGNGCPAVMSHISKVTPGLSGKVWICEFCETQNEVDVEAGEIPTSEETTFLIEAAPAMASVGASGQDESLVVFCLDTSGSMCVTTEVPGHVNIRKSTNDRTLDRFIDPGEDQYLPHQKRNVTNISRLQAVQAAVDKQLETLSKDHPNRRVALIAFNSEVKVIGDGVATEKIIAGGKLDIIEELQTVSAEFELPRPIKDTRQKLSNKVFQLDKGGATALGPSLVAAMELASRHSGSKIILCTDGLANVGVGSLNGSEKTKQNEFYEMMGKKAVDNGVSISVITIKGAEAKLVHLGKLAELSSGQVNLVDPMTIVKEFGNILANRIIATNVKATFILHKNLVFLEEETPNNVIVKTVGNVNVDQEITFQYGKRPGQTSKSKTTEGSGGAEATSEGGKEACPVGGTQEDSQPTDSQKLVVNSPTTTACTNKRDTPSELPFQLQLEYTDIDGTKALRVLTQKREVTRDRNLAERHLNLNVLGGHASSHAAGLALGGQYTQSRYAAHSHNMLFRRNMHHIPQQKKEYREMAKKMDNVHSHVHRRQTSEKERVGSTYSDEEDEEDEDCGAVAKTASSRRPPPPQRIGQLQSKKTRSKRLSEVDDSMAADLYNCM